MTNHPTQLLRHLRVLALLTTMVAAGAAGLLHSASPSDKPAEKPQAQRGEQAGTDFHGDPLPPGAIARLGTSRYRAGCDSIHFSTDGKTLIGLDGGYRVRVWDADNGQLLSTRRLGDRRYRESWAGCSATSADGKTLLIAEGASLQMWDIPSGKRLDVPFPSGCKRLDRIAVCNDRRFLLLLDTIKEQFIQAPLNGGTLGHFEIEQRLILWDTTTGKQRRLAGDEKTYGALGLAPDGKRLASSSNKGTCVYETATGKLLWREPRFNAMHLTFTPDGRRLIAAGSGSNQSEWHVWDADTGKPAPSFSSPQIGYVWTFALSPDGRKLLAPTVTDYVLWDLQKGKPLHRWPGAKQSGKVAFAPDGRSVITADTVLRRWDIASGKALYPDASALGHIAPVRHIYFAPDGKRLTSVGEDNVIRIWDVAAARPVHTIDFGAANPDRWDWSCDGGTTNRDGWTLTPDGRILVGVDKHLTAQRWSIETGRPLPSHALNAGQHAPARLDLGAMHVRVAPDQKTLVLACWPRCPEYSFMRYSFSFWNAETGTLRRWGGDPGDHYRGNFVTLSPDGRWVAADGQLIDTQTGKPRRMQRTRDGAEAVGGVVAFSADSRFVATIDKGGHVWEVASGQPVIALPEAATYRPAGMPDCRYAAFSADGRLFAFAAPHHLVVCDLRTGKVVVKRPAPLENEVNWASGGIAFASNGRTVATGGRDGVILLWDVPAPAPTKPLTEREMSALWEDLTQDAGKGCAAVWRFQEDVARAVPFLRKRLPPVPRPAEDWPALIRQLDSDQFEKREAASRRLKSCGRAAEAPLRQALQDKPTIEQKKRIETLLADLERSVRPIPDLRTVRAVAVLEGINTAEARRVLAEWAEGLQGAPLSEEAARTLARLKWRPAARD